MNNANECYENENIYKNINIVNNKDNNSESFNENLDNFENKDNNIYNYLII